MAGQCDCIAPSKVSTAPECRVVALTSCCVHSPTSIAGAADAFNHDLDAIRSAYRPFDSIIPLDPASLKRIPLSTPPRTPPPDERGTTAQQRVDSRESSVDGSEVVYPLILVTGQSGDRSTNQRRADLLTLSRRRKRLHWIAYSSRDSPRRQIVSASPPDDTDSAHDFGLRSGVVVLDNMANSNLEVLHRVRILASKFHKEQGLPLQRHPPLYFHACDIQDRVGLAAIFKLYSLTSVTSRITSAIHFAALKSVSGSLSDPIAYYQINVGGTLNLVEILARWNAKKLVFSSSCVVYGSECDGEGITEEMCDIQAGASKGITNPCAPTCSLRDPALR